MEKNAIIINAVNALKKGRLVALPTETVYGLCVDATNEQALERLRKVKRRPNDQALSVLLSDISQLPVWASSIPESAYQLAHAFWPGPLTIILKKSPHVSASTVSGKNTIGLRIPHHPLTLSILREFNQGVAAPSANRSGEKSPVSAREVLEALGQDVDLIVDGGVCALGVASTIVDLSGETAKILRMGGIPVQAIEARLYSQQPF